MKTRSNAAEWTMKNRKEWSARANTIRTMTGQDILVSASRHGRIMNLAVSVIAVLAVLETMKTAILKCWDVHIILVNMSTVLPAHWLPGRAQSDLTIANKKRKIAVRVISSATMNAFQMTYMNALTVILTLMQEKSPSTCEMAK